MMKFSCLLSTGIDSPLSCFLMSNFGKQIVIHIDNQKYADEKVITNFHSMLIKLKKVIKNDIVKCYIIPHEETLSEIIDKCKREYTCVICKRMMLRYAQEISKRENVNAIVTGDSLGQVASQTLSNLKVEQQAVDYTVIRPLIGFDKQEIIDRAKDVGIYDESIQSYPSCLAVPDSPTTKAKLSDVLSEEKKLLISDLVYRTVSEASSFSF